MQRLEDDQNESSNADAPVINGKSTKAAKQKVCRSPEEIWDRTPLLSRMNSMECWDYTIELECLNGPQG